MSSSMKFVKQVLLGLAAILVLGGATQADPRWRFASIDGGSMDIGAHDGPVLVVNTASLCAFTPQYEGLQALHETYATRGLLVLAVPSDDFRQELGSDAEVREFCEITFGLDLPMTEITHVRGASAHPFYGWLAEEGVAPNWNFHKVLLDEGRIVDAWGPATRPSDARLRDRIDALLR